tara:strand:- start:165 stop:596 length:432 start_codon:yes stop_codon:yes gene_type:complete
MSDSLTKKEIMEMIDQKLKDQSKMSTKDQEINKIIDTAVRKVVNVSKNYSTVTEPAMEPATDISGGENKMSAEEEEIKKIIDTAVREAINVSKKSSTVISKADEPKSDSEVELAQAILEVGQTGGFTRKNRHVFTAGGEFKRL